MIDYNHPNRPSVAVIPLHRYNRPSTPVNLYKPKHRAPRAVDSGSLVRFSELMRGSHVR